MKTFKYFFSITFCVFLFLAYGAGPASGGDNDGIVVYPDGRWGMDIGGGYQTMPDSNKADGTSGQTMVQPSEYRQEYKDTPYGPQTQQGLAIFPDFRSGSTPARWSSGRLAAICTWSTWRSATR